MAGLTRDCRLIILYRTSHYLQYLPIKLTVLYTTGSEQPSTLLKVETDQIYEAIRDYFIFLK